MKEKKYAKQTQLQSTHLLIYPFTHQHNYAKRTQFQTHPTYANLAKRVTGHESRFIQNEPNLNPKAPTKNEKNANLTQIVHALLQIFTRQMHTFPIIYTPKAAFRKFLKLTHLTQCTTRTYITFSPRLADTHQPTYSYTHSPFYAKQTQLQSTHLHIHSSTQLCKTNPI